VLNIFGLWVWSPAPKRTKQIARIGYIVVKYLPIGELIITVEIMGNLLEWIDRNPHLS
jgi:hypothetical protein